jgi:hypothetical protein
METPHSVERNEGFPVTIEIKSSWNLYGCLRMEAGGVATRKQKDRNAKADEITKIRMGRQIGLWHFEALHKNPCLTRVSRSQTCSALCASFRPVSNPADRFQPGLPKGFFDVFALHNLF